MVLNTATPQIDIDAEKFSVSVDGELVSVAPAKDVPLAQLYWFS
jgi:urease subunit alpha